MEEEKKEKKENQFIRIIKEYGPYLFLLILILLFKKYYYSPVYVSGESMMSTLHDGDIMILDVVGYRHDGLKRFDIVVIDNGKEMLIKRVIGLPGETIEYQENQLYVDGKKVKDIYGNGNTESFQVTVPADEYFVLGDNRENSMDSRFFGPFSKKEILGRTKLVLFPFGRFGNKK